MKNLMVKSCGKQEEWEEVGIRGYTQRNLNLQATLGYYF